MTNRRTIKRARGRCRGEGKFSFLPAKEKKPQPNSRSHFAASGSRRHLGSARKGMREPPPSQPRLLPAWDTGSHGREMEWPRSRSHGWDAPTQKPPRLLFFPSRFPSAPGSTEDAPAAAPSQHSPFMPGFVTSVLSPLPGRAHLPPLQFQPRGAQPRPQPGIASRSFPALFRSGLSFCWRCF